MDILQGLKNELARRKAELYVWFEQNKEDTFLKTRYEAMIEENDRMSLVIAALEQAKRELEGQ